MSREQRTGIRRAVFIPSVLLFGICVIACAVLVWPDKATSTSANEELQDVPNERIEFAPFDVRDAPPERIETDPSDERMDTSAIAAIETAISRNNDSFDDIESDRRSVDTPEKQRVLAPIIQTREQMRRAMADGDPDAIEQVLQDLKDGQAPELDYEIPLLEAALRCLRNNDDKAAAKATIVLDEQGASSMRKFLRRICELD